MQSFPPSKEGKVEILFFLVVIPSWMQMYEKRIKFFIVITGLDLTRALVASEAFPLLASRKKGGEEEEEPPQQQQQPQLQPLQSCFFFELGSTPSLKGLY